MYTWENRYAKITHSLVLSLKFAWWNGSFKHLDDAQFNEAIQIVQQLKNQQYDFIALGEIEVAQQEKLILCLTDTEFELIFGLDTKGKLKFDVAWLIRKTKLVQRSMKSIYMVTPFEQNLKVAYEIELIAFDETLITLYIVHWVSLMRSDFQMKHDLIAHNLRNYLDQNIFANNPRSYIMIMGDFNTEPFNDAMTINLGSTRDYDLAKQKNKVLYNPFWAMMTKNHIYQHNGSYFYSKSAESHWHTFDQILLSSAFLDEQNWTIKKSQNWIFANHQLIKQIKNSQSKFDHLPVTCILEKVF